MCGPWSTLGVVLARAVASVEPNVMLPPLIGSPASLNMFIALVGVSGEGKGGSEGAAREAVVFLDSLGQPTEIDEFPLGSGEGIARTFRPSVGSAEATRTRAIFSVPEVDTLAALGSRTGSTVMPELRKLFFGEPLGFANAHKDTRSPVPAHSYRASLVVGVQPMRSGMLFRDSDGGTPQRFLFLDVADLDAPDEEPVAPDPWEVKMPRWETTGPVRLSVPEAAREVVLRHRRAVLRREGVDPLDSHVMLTRLKVAAGLMLLEGRTVVDDDDWTLAGMLLAESGRVRARAEHALTVRDRAANRARAAAEGERAAIVDDLKHEGEKRRVRTTVLRHLRQKGRMSFRDVSKALKHELRSHLEPVLGELVEADVVREVVDGTRSLYELAEG